MGVGECVGVGGWVGGDTVVTAGVGDVGVSERVGVGVSVSVSR